MQSSNLLLLVVRVTFPSGHWVQTEFIVGLYVSWGHGSQVSVSPALFCSPGTQISEKDIVLNHARTTTMIQVKSDSYCLYLDTIYSDSLPLPPLNTQFSILIQFLFAKILNKFLISLYIFGDYTTRQYAVSRFRFALLYYRHHLNPEVKLKGAKNTWTLTDATLVPWWPHHRDSKGTGDKLYKL